MPTKPRTRRRRPFRWLRLLGWALGLFVSALMLGRVARAPDRLPVGDAFLAWASVVRPWNQPPAPPSTVSPFAGWRWIWMLLWGLVFVLSLVRLVRPLSRSRTTKPA